MEIILSLALPFIVGYIASVYTWPNIKTWVNGAEAEAAALKAKADALIAKTKGLV